MLESVGLKPKLANNGVEAMQLLNEQTFDLVLMDGFLTKKNVNSVREILESPDRRKKMVVHNYEVAKQHYSFVYYADG